MKIHSIQKSNVRNFSKLSEKRGLHSSPPILCLYRVEFFSLKPIAIKNVPFSKTKKKLKGSQGSSMYYSGYKGKPSSVSNFSHSGFFLLISINSSKSFNWFLSPGQFSIKIISVNFLLKINDFNSILYSLQAMLNACAGIQIASWTVVADIRCFSHKFNFNSVIIF